MSDTTTVPQRLSMRDGARHLGCSPRHFYDLAYEGEIATYLAAGHRWVDAETIDAYVERCRAQGPRFGETKKKRPGRPKTKAVSAKAAE
jgi:hypothetical protein